MIALDRFWSIYLAQKVKFTINKLHLTIFICVMFFSVACMNIPHFWVVAYPSEIPDPNNANDTIIVSNCYSLTDFVYIQDLMFILVRSIVPFILIAFVSLLLILKIRATKKNISPSSSNSHLNSTATPTNAGHSASKKREMRFTIAVCFINGSFIFLNLIMFIYLIISYSVFDRSPLLQVQILLLGTIGKLLSFMFTLFEFWRDLLLNRLFRKEVFDFFLIITGNNKKIKNSQK